jgi:putative transposase
LQVTTTDLDKAFQAFFRRVKTGNTPGYPRFRSQNRFDSFGLKEYGNGFKLDGRRLKLSGIGRVAVRWHRPIQGQIKTIRVRKQVDKWYACFVCEVEVQPLEPTEQEVGIDVGIISLLTTSDGEHIENPKWYCAKQAKLRVLQRRVSRRKKGSTSRCKAVQALQRQHEHIANRRSDFIKKTVHGLIARYDRIAIEDLQVANMIHNHHLSKSIADAGWGYFRLQLFSKAAYAGRIVVAVNPAYTSKTCSQCETIFENLTLADRWVRCKCGLSMDRDENAARNLLRLGRDRWSKTWSDATCVLQEAAEL